MRLTYTDRTFIFECDYSERETPKRAGFFFSTDLRKWCTYKIGSAARLRDYADHAAREKIDASMIRVSLWRGRVPYPKGLKPYTFQLEAARFALARNKSYLALDPGLGKTIVAALIINALAEDSPTTHAVILCPPFLVLNFRAELEKWCLPEVAKKVTVVPDSLIPRAEVRRDVMAAVFGDDAVLIVDEAHRYKSGDAKRTQALLGGDRPSYGDGALLDCFNRVVFLSGTPMPNRPMELYSILSTCAPEVIGYRDKFSYGTYFCAGYQNRFGWDFTGASNTDELFSALKDQFMLRVRKDDVLKDLPPKTEELVFLGENVPPKIAALEKQVLAKLSPDDDYSHLAENGHVATYRRELGLLKARHAVGFLKELLAETDESILIFAHHTAVIEQLQKDLTRWKPLVIKGDTPHAARFESVARFQTDKSRRVLIGNIQAMGVGFTLTKATRVAMVEASWVPAENAQAGDRAHRVGQKDHVLVQYFVFKNSIDRKVIESNLRKMKLTETL